MKAAIAMFLLFAALFFFWYDSFILALACAAIAIYLILSKPASLLAKDIAKDMEEAEGQVPSADVWKEGIKEAGSRTGEQLFSDKESVTRIKEMNTTKFKFKPNKIGEGSKKVIELFKKLFD